MTALLCALAAAYGTFLLYTAVVLGWRGLRPSPATPTGGLGHRLGRRCRGALVQAGLADVRVRDVVAVLGCVVTVGALAGTALFGPGPATVVTAVFAGLVPLGAYRSRRDRRRSQALDAWPRIIEEIRVLTAASGRSVPNVLFAAGSHGPAELQPAFAAAHREWLLSTNLERSIAVLKAALADPTADAVCETLLVAHQVGGTDLDGRLHALADDRVLDVQGRKDARAHQAGARFARRFVLVVPAGMAFAGLSIGDGRSAYTTAFGQTMVVVAVTLIAACWFWAGRIMALPRQERVFP